MLVVENGGGGCAIVGLLARFLHVDSSHSGLISANSKGLAGARSIQEGVIIKKRRSRAALMASAPTD